MRVREGGGGKEGKIRLITYARFWFSVGRQLLFKRYFEHAIITCHCVNSERKVMWISYYGGAFDDGSVMFSLRSTTAQAR